VLTTCLLVYTDTLTPQFQLQHFPIVITYNVVDMCIEMGMIAIQAV